jgi:hypothetical protein
MRDKLHPSVPIGRYPAKVLGSYNGGDMAEFLDEKRNEIRSPYVSVGCV